VEEGIQEYKSKYPEAIPGAAEDLIDLLQRILVYEPSQRLSAKEILNHAWFKSAEASKLPKDEIEQDIPKTTREDLRVDEAEAP